MRFLIETAVEDLATEWKEIGVTDAAGKEAAKHAVEQLAECAGKYRVRPADDPKAAPALLLVDGAGPAMASYRHRCVNLASPDVTDAKLALGY